MILVIVALSLSMDSFSLALAYGTLKIDKKTILFLSFIVGLFHFIMPIIGMYISDNFTSVVNINPNFIVTLVLNLVGINMIIDTFKKNEVRILRRYELFIFALAVSIDSFSVGITLKTISNNFFLGPTLFSISSFLFTFIGLKIGNLISKIFGASASLIGGLILIIIGLNYVL